jgi:hypothetical protein
MAPNSSLSIQRRVPSATTVARNDLVVHRRPEPMQWEHRGDFTARQAYQQTWCAFRKALREIAWLASMVGGLSFGGVALAVMLVQPKCGSFLH